nr:MAG TPA: hypothetical protein [Caudoviricetes sp.]
MLEWGCLLLCGNRVIYNCQKLKCDYTCEGIFNF